jgi:hypothetical protein
VFYQEADKRTGLVPILPSCRVFGHIHAVQGWSSVIPRFSAVDFFSFYVELFVMGLMYLLWLVVHRVLKPLPLSVHQPTSSSSTASAASATSHPTARPFFDFVDPSRVDLYHDEHEDEPFDKHEDEARRMRRMHGSAGWAWILYYYIVS